MGLKGIFFEIAKDARNLLFQLRVALYKLLRCAGEKGGPDKDIHPQSSSSSSRINSSAVPRLTLPALTSSNEARTLAIYASFSAASNS
jgi:hypothetical protein